MERFIGVIGFIFLLLLAWSLSYHRWKVNIRTVLVGVGLQFAIGFLLLHWDLGDKAIGWLALKVTSFLELSRYGAEFLFGNLARPEYFENFGFQFAFIVLPAIIFFASFMAILYYLGIMQYIVKGFAWIMARLMGTSGAESLSCSANVFVGMTEAPLIIRPFLARCTLSELTAIMVGGFGTIAGSVMAGYIAMGIPAKFVIIASCMAVPTSLYIAKIIFPETEHPETAGKVHIPNLDTGNNVLDAASKGVTDGLRLALNVGAMLVAFVALIALVDKILAFGDGIIDGKIFHGVVMANGEYSGYFPGSLSTLFGWIFYPIVYVMGIPAKDVFTVGNLLGTKISINEFVAYSKLAPMIKEATLSPKSIAMVTFMLCGFANFASIGITIGGISALAPHRRSDLARLGVRAMLGGAIVSCLSAIIAGLLFKG